MFDETLSLRDATLPFGYKGIFPIKPFTLAPVKGTAIKVDFRTLMRLGSHLSFAIHNPEDDQPDECDDHHNVIPLEKIED